MSSPAAPSSASPAAPSALPPMPPMRLSGLEPVTLDAGSRDGIKVDQNVVSGRGLVGRVVSVTSSTATAPTAIRSRVAVP